MVKSIISAACALIILFAAAFYEGTYVKNTFNAFHSYLSQTEEKLERQTACAEDARALQRFWLDKKRVLHVFIPHNEIKEIDLWLAECAAFTAEGDFEEAKSKITVLLCLSEQIPKTFLLKAENIF